MPHSMLGVGHLGTRKRLGVHFQYRRGKNDHCAFYGAAKWRAKKPCKPAGRDANSTAGAHREGQRKMHELAASLQEAQRQAAQQQAHEWRAALLQASQEHAMVVEQLQAQLKTSEEKQLTLQAHLRDARRASAVAAAAAIANGKAGGANGEALEQAVERAVSAEREAAIARVSAAEDATERCLDTECSAARASQAEAACIQRQLTEKNRATQAQLTEMKGHSSSSRPPTWPSCRRHCERHDSRPRQRWRACGLRSDRSERSSFRSRRRR